MKISLLPQPQSVRTGNGVLKMPGTGTIFVADGMFRDAAEDACSFLNGYEVVTAPAKNRVISFIVGKCRNASGYNLAITHEGVTIEAGSAAGAFWGVQTLRQIVVQSRRALIPLLDIKDWPIFETRGLSYDVTRGRVPKTERLKELAEKLSHYKVNHLQLYLEHTFRFRGHPEIGKNSSPLTSEDILELDEFCRDRYVELVPSLASLGHLSHVLSLPQYRHLAEDWGVGKYVSPDADKLPEWQRRIAWTLSPANPEVYAFLESLFQEFLPLFSSGKFNICCDETWDLGLGQSYELCRKQGKGRVYLDHILRLRDMAAKYGKRIMFWGDIIRNHPELLKEIPKDVTLLDWGYDHNHPYGRTKDFKKAGLTFHVCPGTGAWNSLFPRLPEAMANIHGFAMAGCRNEASGLLNTDWGDGGHYNFMEFSWPGYLLGAEQSWNVKAGLADFVRRFCRVFLNSTSPALAKALFDLGDIAQLQVRKNRDVWQEIFFAVPGDAVLGNVLNDAWVSRSWRISSSLVRLDARLARKTIEKLVKVRMVLVKHARNNDKNGILPYWIFAVDTLIHSARKLTVLGHGGRDTMSGRRMLKKELMKLLKEFKVLWIARNRISEINITIDKYRKVIKSL